MKRNNIPQLGTHVLGSNSHNFIFNFKIPKTFKQGNKIKQF